MPAVALKPRTPAAIVDAAIQLLRRIYPQLATLTVVALAPAVVLVLVVGGAPGQVAATVLVALVQYLCTTVAEAATIVAVSDGYLDGEVRVGSALRRTIRRLGSIIGAALERAFLAWAVAAIGILIGSIALSALLPSGLGLIVGTALGAVPAGYILLRTFAATPAVMIEGASASEAIARSWRLAGGAIPSVLLALVLGWLLYVVLFAVLLALSLTALATAPTVAAVMRILLLALAYPIAGAVTTLLYYDLRVRREGFDLELMARELEREGGAERARSDAPVR